MGREMADMLSMGGYGAFVWPAYAISAVTLAGLTFGVLARARRARRRLADLEKRNG
jgi:heme exporter protein D